MDFDFATFGDADVFAPSVVLFALWLWAVGLSRTVGGFLLGIAMVAVSTLALKWAFAAPHGSTLWPDGTLISQYFPSGHAALATAVYGSLSIILAGAGGGAWRYAPCVALALAVVIAALRVLARVHPVGDAFFGVVIGLAGPVATYFAVIRETRPFPAARTILTAFALALATGWVWPAPFHALLAFAAANHG